MGQFFLFFGALFPSKSLPTHKHIVNVNTYRETFTSGSISDVSPENVGDLMTAVCHRARKNCLQTSRERESH